MKNLMVFSSSNSKASINAKLVKYSTTFLKNSNHSYININDYETTIYSIDKEIEQGIPKEIVEFKKLIDNCDGIIISLAEHNSSFTVIFKNIIDWLSRINYKFLANKKLLLLSTSPGKYGGKNVMQYASDLFPKFNAEIVNTFSLPSFQDNFNDENGIINEDLKNDFIKIITDFEKKL